MAIEIVDLPINSMVIFHSYVTVFHSLPEGEMIFHGDILMAMAKNDWQMIVGQWFLIYNDWYDVIDFSNHVLLIS